MPKDHNAVTPVRLEPTAPRSRVKHSTTEPLRSLNSGSSGSNGSSSSSSSSSSVMCGAVLL